MNRRWFVFAVVTFGLLMTVSFIHFPKNVAESGRTPILPSPRPRADGPPSVSPTVTAQIDRALLSPQQIAAEVARRDRIDRKWEWKIAIRFYGVVLDESERPLAGANVHFQWTNLSGRGTADADATTDLQGHCSLENVDGKSLLVRVSKSGYYSTDSRNRWSFEYANPFEETFYQPHAAAPVIFHLRKQKPAADVTSRSVEMVLSGDGTPLKLDLLNGNISAEGQLEVQAWKPWPPRPMEPPYEWKIVLAMQGGGFVETREDFAFEAPETGYEDPYVIDMSPTLGSLWKVSAERSLYFVFGEPRKYGRMSLRTDGGSRYIFLDYVINQSGLRDVESVEKRK